MKQILDKPENYMIIGLLILNLIALILFLRRPKKENMLSHVVIACLFVVEILAVLVLNGHHAEYITFAFWEFFATHPIVGLYFGIINVIGFSAFALDKKNAVEGRRRIRIVTLLFLSFIGGAIGGLLAMQVFRHKTQTKYFTVGLPLMLVIQVLVIFYCMNAGKLNL
ncbi:MAG: DUF1294 domain-containing protein [Wujia sp.]